MAGSDLGSSFPSPIHTPLSILFAAPRWVCSALCSCPWFSRVTDSVDGAVSALWNRTGQGLFPELARSVGTAGRPSSAQCPGPGERPSGCSGPQRRRAGSGAAPARVSHGASGEQRGWKDRGTRKVPGRQCQGAAEGTSF